MVVLCCTICSFWSLTAVLGKIGITGIESNLGTAIRTGIVLVMAWSMVFITGKQSEIHNIDRREIKFQTSCLGDCNWCLMDVLL